MLKLSPKFLLKKKKLNKLLNFQKDKQLSTKQFCFLFFFFFWETKAIAQFWTCDLPPSNPTPLSSPYVAKEAYMFFSKMHYQQVLVAAADEHNAFGIWNFSHKVLYNCTRLECNCHLCDVYYSCNQFSHNLLFLIIYILPIRIQWWGIYYSCNQFR